MTITIIPNQIPLITQSLMAIYAEARKGIDGFRAQYPDYNEIIIEAKLTDAEMYAKLYTPDFDHVARLQLFVEASALESDICALVYNEMMLVAEAC